MIRIILLLGFIINFSAYGNFYSSFVFLSVLFISNMTKRFFLKKNKNETDVGITIWFISIMYLFSGISELAIINFGEMSVGPDATRFFRYSSDPTWDFRNFIVDNLGNGYQFDNLIGFKEDFLPILLWNKVYLLFSFLNIPAGRYVGLGINTLFMVWTSYIGISILRSINILNNNDTENFYKILFCSNGIFWMYGAIHLRESIIVFFISILLKVWIDWINKKSFINLIKIGIISIFYYFLSNYLRGGYSYVVFIFLTSYVFLESYKTYVERKIDIKRLIFLILFATIIILNIHHFMDLPNMVQERLNSYNSVSFSESSAGSLGVILINQPILIRSFLSIFYLLFFPIPFWAGQGEIFSIYHFFKSSFGIYNLITFPIFIIVIKDLIINRINFNIEKFFLLALFFQISVLIGLTSLDTRHFGNFGLIYILLLCFFNFEKKSQRDLYKVFLNLTLSIMYGLYLVYIIYKFQSILLTLLFVITPATIYFFLKREKENIP